MLVPQRFRTDWFYAVRKDYEHPEALLKLFNMHLEKNWGETGDFNKYYMPVENDGVGVWKFSPVRPAIDNKNLVAFNEIEEARKLGDMSILTGEAAQIAKNIELYFDGETSLWGWDKIYGEDGVFHNLNDYIENDQIIIEEFVGAPTPTMVKRQATLEQLELESFTRIIMGQDPIDAFDSFVETWYASGGEDITNEVNQWLEESR